MRGAYGPFRTSSPHKPLSCLLELFRPRALRRSEGRRRACWGLEMLAMLEGLQKPARVGGLRLLLLIPRAFRLRTFKREWPSRRAAPPLSHV
jgi:hypothetical protein